MLHIPSTNIFKMAANTTKTDREQMKKAILTVDSESKFHRLR